jgi:hypothetical protein
MRFKSPAQRKAVMAKYKIGDIVRFPRFKVNFKVVTRFKYLEGDAYFYRIKTFDKGKVITRIIDEYEVKKIK